MRHYRNLPLGPARRAGTGLRPRGRRIRGSSQETPERPDDAAGVAAREAARGAGSSDARPAAGSAEQAGRGAGRISDRGGHESGQRRHRRCAAQNPRAAANARGRAQRGQDPARDVDRQVAESRAGGLRAAGRRAAAHLAGLPRCQRARRLHRHRALRQPQHRLRSDVPRRSHHDRLEQRDARPGARRGVVGDAEFLQGHRAANHHRRARHGGQTPRVRRRGRPHVLLEQRRPQGNDRPAAHRRRCAPDCAVDGDQRADDQGHAGTGRRGRTHHSGDRQGAARGGDRRRAARGQPDEAA